MKKLLAVIALSVCVVAACSAQASTHAARRASTTADGSPLALIAATARAECARFSAADTAITSGTELDVTVGELAGSLYAEGPAWGKELARAEREPSLVPHGDNRANNVSLDIAETAVALGMADLDNDLGHDGLIKGDWSTTLRGLSRTRKACR